MQLYKNRSHYLFVNGQNCLWCNRFDGTLEAKSGSSISDLKSLEFMCHVEGIVGKIQVFPDSEAKLIIILAKSTVAQIARKFDIFAIDKVGLLPLSPNEPQEDDRLLFSGKIPSDIAENPSKSSENLSESNLILMNRGVQKTLKTLRQATNFSMGLKGNKRDRTDRDKLERRILEDVIKMFNDSRSFYYSHSWDLTHTMQRLFRIHKHNKETKENSHPSDERFFWNRDLWKDLLHEVDDWIIPVVQGYVQQEDVIIDLNSFDSTGQPQSPLGEYIAPVCCRVILISRRSRFRAGTRYKRRGIDEKGNCANYVETEQILEIMGHCLSFVQVRGSIPVFWSQPGMRYRPAPRLDRSETESHAAFAQHFAEQLKIYKHEILVNLVEQTGREKILAEAYLNGILNYDNESLVYVSFDFHEYCRGLRLENIGILIQSLHEVFQRMHFFWCKRSNVCEASDDQIMCQQRSVFRVNCVDCLDRTNVIQASFARYVLESQLRKMGLLLPETEFPADFRQTLQAMWANNGDVISRQYAGTSALKGDVTRTGERKLAGLMKDGYTSANRYYLNQFKDAYRQAAIDACLGKYFQEESILVPGVSSSAMDPSESERVKQLVDDCKRILVPETEIALGGWPMIDADSRTGDPSRQDMDTVLLLSTKRYYFAEYSDESDQLVGYQKVPLEDVESIEIGQEMSMFRTGRIVIRINYHIGEVSGYCHVLRTAGLRFFNNMIMPVNTQDDSLEMLRSIAETFRMALESQLNLVVPVMFGPMPKKTSKIPPKEAAPREAEGGIFTAARTAPSHVNLNQSQMQSKQNLGEVLSAVKSKLAGFNPMGRLAFPHRDAASATVSFSKDGDRSGLVPSISIQSPTCTPALSERGSSELVDSGAETSTETSPVAERKFIEAVLDSCGVSNADAVPLVNIEEPPPSVPVIREPIQSDEAGFDSPRRFSIKQRHQSRSSEALDNHLLDLTASSPLALSASPSMKAFHDESGETGELIIPVSENESRDTPVKFGWNDDSEPDIFDPPLVIGAPRISIGTTISPSASMRVKNIYENSRSKGACKTKIIEL